MSPVPNKQMDDTEKSRPPADHLRALWERISRPPSEVPEVSDAWAARGIDVEKVENQNLARALPEDAALPDWAKIGSQRWSEYHRLILRMFDAMGRLASLHARAVSDSNAGWCGRKALNPAGFESGGLVFASPMALLMLEDKPLGIKAARESGVLIVEGATDFLTMATRAQLVLGIINGSWSREIAERIPSGARVLVTAHDDDAGHRYVEEVRDSLDGRCGMLRAFHDWNDLLKAGKLPADPFSLGEQFPSAGESGDSAPPLDASDPRAKADALNVLAGAVDTVRNAAEGNRNNTLAAQAPRCFQVAAIGLLDPDEIDAAFLEVAHGWEPEELKKAVSTLKRARKYGLKNPLRDNIALVAKGRPQVRWNELDREGCARAIEGHLIETGLYRIDQTWVRVCEHDLPYVRHPDDPKLPAPKQLQCLPLDQTAMLLGIERAVCLVKERQKGGPKPIPVPVKVLPTLMLELPDKAAPQITGLVQHPVLMPDGRLIEDEGYDKQSGLYLAFGGQTFPKLDRRPTRDDGVAAAKRLRKLLFSEVPFREPATDGAALLALYLAGVARKVLPQAPAGLITAAVQGTGKTTAARMLHVVLTGRDMPVQSVSPDKNEFQKAIFATLMRQPAMVCFDNLPDATTLDSPELARIITAPMYEGRVLGLSKMMTVPTNTLVTFTGNAITVAADLTRRIIKVDLLAKEARPEQHQYQHQDVVRYVQSVRVQVIADLLTIQLACRRKRRTRFGCGPEFDALVTWPLEFAGEEGLFAKREELAQESPDERAKIAALLALANVYGVVKVSGKAEGKEFTPADAVRKMVALQFGPPARDGSPERELRDAIEEANPNRVKSVDALGRFLGQLVDQPLREGLRLKARIVHGSRKYRIEGEKESEPTKGKLD